MSSKEFSDTAAPSVSTVVAQEGATIASPAVGAQGLAVETMPDVISSAVVENTVLTNADSNVETTALTEYHDAQTTQKATIPYKAVDIVDANFVFPPGFFRVIERSVPLLTVDIPQSDPEVYPFLRLDLLSGLLGIDFIQSKLNYPAFVRFNLEVQVKILATNFHFGQIMLVWRPAYAPFLKANWVGLNMSDDVIKCHFPPASWDPYGPYDCVTTASQLPHQILPITAGTSATMELPWTLNRQYVPTKQMCHPSHHIGYLDVYLLTPCMPVDIDKPKIQVFARFKDIMGFGYRSVQSYAIAKSSAIIRRVFYTQDNAVNHDGFLVANPVNRNEGDVFFDTQNLKNITLQTITHGLVSGWSLWFPWALGYSLREYKQMPKRKAEKVSTEVLESNSVGEYHALQEGSIFTNTWTKVTKTANAIMAYVGSGLAALGLSKPPTPDLPTRIYEVAPPLSSSECVDFTISTGINQVSLVKNDELDHPEQVLLEKMAAIPTYMGYYIFNNTDRTWKNWFGPRTVRWSPNRNFGLFTPAGLISQKFLFWRGNLYYRLHFSSSSFVNARFAVLIEYFDDGNLQQGIVPTQYVEVKGDSIVEGEVPFLHPAPWANFVDSDARQPFRITVTMIDDPVSWKADQSPPIVMSLWIAWRGFQVAGMTQGIECGVPWGFASAIVPRPQLSEQEKIRATEVFESNDLPGKVPALPPVSCGMNDIPISAYHIAKRYVQGRGMSFTPFAPYMVMASYTTTGPRYCVTWAPINSYLMKCFRWVRGSANVVTDSIDTIFDQYYQALADECHTMIGFEWSFSNLEFLRRTTARPYMKKLGQKLLAVRQPYRSNYPYVSGPHVFVSSTSVSWSYDNFRVESMAESLKGEILDTFVFDRPQTDINKAREFSYAYGDDLCYKQWMGVPLMCTLRSDHLSGFIWGPDA